MAFGANKGTWLFGANSIVANNQATLSTGSAVVAKGDLIVVVIGEVVANTSSGATDTLGNTYTAITAGTLVGATVSGRAFYTIVTNPGTNTNINVQATASANNVAIVAASYEGSFSAIDKQPANNNNTDNASPFTCPATGTLAQQLEVIVAWMVDNTANVKTATSPNIKANQQSQVTVSSVLGSQVVHVTTTVSPAWTGTNPTASIQGTASFRAAGLPTGEVAVSFPITLIQSGSWRAFRTFTLGPNPNLSEVIPPPPVDTDTVRAPHFSPPRKPESFPFDIPPNLLTTSLGPILFPFNQFDWPLAKTTYHHINLRSWAGVQQPPAPLAAALPTGASALDLPPKSYDFNIQLRTWVTQFRPTAAVALPFNQYDWLVPRNYEFNVSLRSWNISPRPVEVVVVVDTSVPRAPHFTRPREPALLLSTQPLRPLTLFAAPVQVPFKQPDWPVARAALQAVQSWTASYNLNLIGQDKLPTGKIITDRPTLAAIRVTDLGTWISQTKLLLAVPFGQSDWPLPRGPLLPQRSWVWSYNLNLIGKDQLPVGGEITDLVPRAPLSANQLRTWIYNTALALITAPIPKPFAQYDWPLNFGPLQPVTIFTATYNKNLIGKDIVPGKIISDLPPRAPQQPAQSFTGKYNENLIGKDKLPTGAEITDLPPQPALSAIQLRTWIQTVNLALVVQAAVLPNNQSDWPITLPPRPQARTFIGFYNLNLIGKDLLPINQSDWPLPRTHLLPQRSWTASYNLNLIGKDQLPIGETVTDRPAQQRLAAQTWINAVNLVLAAAPIAPFSQQDWQRPIAAVPFNRSFASFYNPNLIGKDRLPFRQQDWPIWRDYQRAPPSFTAFYNRNLIGKDRLPFRQQDWPLPGDPRRLSDWINLTNPNLFIPGPAPPPPRSPSHRDVSLAIAATRFGEGEQIRPDDQQPRRPAAPRSTRSNIQDPRTRR